MAARWILENIGQRLWGFKPRLMSHIVEQNGGLASIRWFAGNMPAYEKILKNWGPIRTHIISVTTSLINGCPYCTFGHAYSFQLHHFKNTGELFPLSDKDILELSSLSPPEIVNELCKSLKLAGLEEEVHFVKRTATLMNEPDHQTDKRNNEDKNILHLIGMFKMLNTCGINGNVSPDEAHDPINKNKELIENYQRSRAAISS